MSEHLFYHSDMDGHAGGVILFQKGMFPHEMDYDHYRSPKEFVNPGDDVWIVDYSFQPGARLWLKENAGRVVWIDHHKSAINDSRMYGYDDLEGIREVGPSGAELAWRFMRGKEPAPRFIRLAGDYDTYRSYGKRNFAREVVPFHYGSDMILADVVPGSFGAERLKDDGFLADIMEKGQVIRQFKDMEAKAIYRESAYVRNLWGHRCLCVNTPEPGSLYLTMTGIFDPAKHDLMFTYSFDGKVWSYGWYTNGHPEVDCSEIARQYGGGGHASASGAHSDKPIEGIF